MADVLFTEDEADQRRLSRLSVESDDKNVVQVELLYRTKWIRFEIDVLALQHLPTDAIWSRYLAPALKSVEAPEPVLADPVIPEAAQVAVADIGVVDSIA